MPTDPNIGRTLNKKYELVRLIGEGGMGAVYEAHHRLIQRRLAVKLLHADYATDSGIVKRFQREARTATAIGHEHIVDITDMGMTGSGELFIVMEYLEGRDLSGIIKQEGLLSPQRACHIMIQVLSALEAAHSKGIIHRDLKPANIFLINQASVSDYVKLVDFGISKVRASEEGVTAGLTRTGELLGTPAYMSPEQARGELGITPATDIYAVGIILYEMVTGRLPFSAGALPALLMKILSEPPVHPCVHQPDVPQPMGAAIVKALEKAPENRLADAAAFRRLLTPYSPDTATLTGLLTTRLHSTPPSAAEIARASRAVPNRQDKAISRTPLDLVATSASGNRQRSRLVFGLLISIVLLGSLALALIVRVFDNEPPGAAVVPLMAAGPAPKKVPVETPVVSPEQEGSSKPQSVKRIRFNVSASPNYAEILLDGHRLGTGTVETEFKADSRAHETVVSATGYRTYREQVSLTSDVSITVNLEPLPRRRSAAKKNQPSAGSAPTAPASAATEVSEGPRPEPQRPDRLQSDDKGPTGQVVITEKVVEKQDQAPPPEPVKEKGLGRIIDESAPW